MTLCRLHSRDEVTPCEERQLAKAIGAIGGYVPRDIGNANVASAMLYTDRLVDYGRRLRALLVPPMVDRTVVRRPSDTAGTTVTTWRFERFDDIGCWIIPDPIRRKGAVVTVPGGPLPRPQWASMEGHGVELARLLGVPVLLWDYDSMDGSGHADIGWGVEEGRRFGGPVVLVSHSFGGVPAAYEALGCTIAPTAFVAISSILSLDDVSATPGDAYRAAGADPRTFRRRIPISVIAGTRDLPGTSPARARDFAQAYSQFGGTVRLLTIEGADHNQTLMDLTAIEEVGRYLG